MKFQMLLFLLAASTSALATPCFIPGTYQGKGFAEDAAGKAYPYDVSTTISDSESGTSSYVWNSGGYNAKWSFQAKGSQLLVDGQDVSASIQCGMAAEHLVIPGKENVDEEWTFVGNYLLRHGHKTIASGPIGYQELLIRQ